MHVDLRPWDVRLVEVLVDGQWLSADLEAYRRDASGWSGLVRYSKGPGMDYLEWVSEERLKPPSPSAR